MNSSFGCCSPPTHLKKGTGALQLQRAYCIAQPAEIAAVTGVESYSIFFFAKRRADLTRCSMGLEKSTFAYTKPAIAAALFYFLYGSQLVLYLACFHGLIISR